MPSLTIDQPVFLAMLNRVAPFVHGRATVPILECVKLEIADGFTVTGNNLDIMATVKTGECAHEGTGAICVFASRFREIVRLCDPGVRIKLKWQDGGTTLEFESGAACYSLSCLPASDFPVMEEKPFTHTFSLPVEDAKLLFQKTAFAICTEETRYYLNGIYLHAIDSKLRAVATDGHRMAIQDVPLPDGAADMPGAIVPSYTARGLGRLLNGRGLNGIHVSVGRERIRVEIGGLSILSRLIDGTYPNYHRVVPHGGTIKMTAASRHIGAAARRVRMVASDARKNSPVACEVTAGALTVSAKSHDFGAATEKLPVETHGDAIKIGLNARYLLEGLAAHGDIDVTIEMIDPGSPAKITGAPGLTVIQMPMRI